MYLKIITFETPVSKNYSLNEVRHTDNVYFYFYDLMNSVV